MKKAVITTAVFALITFICSAQTVLDTAYIKCYYTYRYMRDTANISNMRSDEMTLLIGKKVSKFYCYSAFQIDSLMISISEGNGDMSDFSARRSNYKGGEYFKVYRNYPENKITFTDKIMTTVYLYEEAIPIQEWKIHNDTATVSGYKCRKATCKFRGRDYEAWFTVEIPINSGPYKFGGLPGLIVKISDTKLNHVFELTGTETVKEPVLFETRDYLETNRKDYTSVYRKYKHNFINFLKENMGVISYSSDSPLPVWNNDVIERDVK
ncbi:MAG: GLPGLI family protein [Prevotellaceae bacterium]|jgi:GLPGLI family protein|nr:GLPGLI family protein [Prevotellaceae bacterium]